MIRGYTVCTRSHGWEVLELILEPSSVSPEPLLIATMSWYFIAGMVNEQRPHKEKVKALVRDIKIGWNK